MKIDGERLIVYGGGTVRDLAKYKVSIAKLDGQIGVGIEQYINGENGHPEIIFIGSYFIGNASRQDVVRFYVKEIIKRHNNDVDISIRIHDKHLYWKRRWLTIYSENITFKIERNDNKFKTCQILAFDALKESRKNTITEELL